LSNPRPWDSGHATPHAKKATVMLNKSISQGCELLCPRGPSEGLGELAMRPGSKALGPGRVLRPRPWAAAAAVVAAVAATTIGNDLQLVALISFYFEF